MFVPPSENGADDDPHPSVELEPWVRIQSATFTNWCNDKLRVLDLEIEDLGEDFRDGIRLCRLMEVLKGHKIGRVINKANVNHYEASGNLALALDAMKKDDVRLVNIGQLSFRMVCIYIMDMIMVIVEIFFLCRSGRHSRWKHQTHSWDDLDSHSALPDWEPVATSSQETYAVLV